MRAALLAMAALLLLASPAAADGILTGFGNCGGLLQPECPKPGNPAPPPVIPDPPVPTVDRVNLSVAPKEAPYTDIRRVKVVIEPALRGKGIRITGRTRDTHRLLYSYARTTNSAGTVTFLVRPELNLIWQARDLSSKRVSKKRSTFTLPRRLYEMVEGRRRNEMRLGYQTILPRTIRGESSPPAGSSKPILMHPKIGKDRRAYFYSGPRRGARFTRFASIPLHTLIKGNTIRRIADLYVRVSSGAYNAPWYSVCTRYTTFLDASVAVKDCGERTLRPG